MDFYNDKKKVLYNSFGLRRQVLRGEFSILVVNLLKYIIN